MANMLVSITVRIKIKTTKIKDNHHHGRREVPSKVESALLQAQDFLSGQQFSIGLCHASYHYYLEDKCASGVEKELGMLVTLNGIEWNSE